MALSTKPRISAMGNSTGRVVILGGPSWARDGFADKGDVCDLKGSAIEFDRWTGTSVGGLYGAISGEEGGDSTKFAFDAFGVGRRALA
jgi:hypothetical protein